MNIHLRNSPFRKCWLLLICLLLPETSVFSQDDDGDDEFDFGDESEVELESSSPVRFKVGLELGQQIGNPERQMMEGLSVQGIFDWASDWGQVYGEGTGSYNRAWASEDDHQDIIEEYEVERVLRELYWKKSYGDFTLTLGQGIVVWGKGDFLSVLDLVSPQDLSRSFFAKPEDSRLGQNLVRVQYWTGGQSLELILIPKPSMNRIPEPGHPYSPEQWPGLGSREPGSDDYEIGARLALDDGDLAVAMIGGRFHNRNPLVKTESPQISYKTWQAFSAFGLASTVAVSPWLLKSELLVTKDYPWQKYDSQTGFSIELRETAMVMVGLDYNHQEYGLFIVEANMIGLADDPPEHRVDTDEVEGQSSVAMSWNRSFLQDLLSLDLALIYLDHSSQNINRGGFSWELRDNLTVTGSLTRINAPDQSQDLYGFRGFDRVDMGLYYFF